MGNLEERFRQIQEKEKQQKMRHEAKVLSTEQERKSRELQAFKEAQSQNKRLKDELMSTLESVSARELLQQVRDEVWKVGTVDPAFTFKEEKEVFPATRTPAFAMLALRFQYKTAVEIMTSNYREEPLGGWSGDSQGGGSGGESRTGFYRVGTKETILAVKVRRRFDNRLSIEANSNSDISGSFSTDVITKDSLEQLLLEECVERARSQYLPLQLQTKGQEDIKRLVPLHRRLFR